jgi:tetratricopeptide (TPR) repeat protein
MRSGLVGLLRLTAIPLALFMWQVLLTHVRPNAWALVNVAISVPAYILGMLAHEAGHALVAWTVGLAVPRIEIGTGRHVWSGRWRGAIVRVNATLISAGVFVAPKERSFERTRLWLTNAAGPLASLLLAWIAIAFTGRGFPAALAPRFVLTKVDPLAMLVLANVVIGIGNAVPFRTKQSISDGFKLLAVPFMSRKQLDELYAFRYLLEGLDAQESNRLAEAVRIYDEGLQHFPENASLRHDRAVAFVRMRRYAEGLADFRKLVDHPDAHPSTRAMTRSNAAWCLIRLGDPGSYPEADQLSATAYESLRHVPAVVGTRGAVLVRLGRFDEAVPLLERARDEARTDENRAYNACALAVAYASLGDLDKAQSRLHEARSLQPENDMIPEAEVAVGPRVP